MGSRSTHDPLAVHPRSGRDRPAIGPRSARDWYAIGARSVHDRCAHGAARTSKKIAGYRLSLCTSSACCTNFNEQILTRAYACTDRAPIASGSRADRVPIASGSRADRGWIVSRSRADRAPIAGGSRADFAGTAHHGSPWISDRFDSRRNLRRARSSRIGMLLPTQPSRCLGRTSFGRPRSPRIATDQRPLGLVSQPGARSLTTDRHA